MLKMGINQIKIIISLNKESKSIIDLIKQEMSKEYEQQIEILNKKKLNNASIKKALRKHFFKDINSTNKTINILKNQGFIKNKQKSCGRDSKKRKTKDAIYTLDYKGILTYLFEEFFFKPDLKKIYDKRDSNKEFIRKELTTTKEFINNPDKIYKLIQIFLNTVEEIPNRKKKLFEIFIYTNSNKYIEIQNQKLYLKKEVKINESLEIFFQLCNIYSMKNFYLKQSNRYSGKIYDYLELDDNFNIF